MQYFMQITISIHQYTAILAGILMPVLFLARKGTRFHVLFGKFLLAVSIVLVAFAILTVINPAFGKYWADDIARHQWHSFFSIFGLGTAFLWWIAAIYSYSFFSAIRVWPRLRAHRAGSRSSNLFDYLLTLLPLTIGVYYGALSVVEAVATGSAYPRLLPISVVFIGFGLWDLVTYFRPISSFRVAALTHGSRLFVAWWMLVIGVLIRQRQNAPLADGGFAEYFINSILIAVFLLLLLYWNRQISSAPTAPGLSPAR